MNRKEEDFIKTVWQHYREHGRHDLLWRQRSHLTPYRILVSEVMLQQTQVDRVRPKYRAFLKQWGSARALAGAPLSEVLKVWQGLGYNRRAKHLHEAAKRVVRENGGRFPRSYHGLLALPGAGPYTAGAILAFAYNEPVPIIETNIRSVYTHHFFAYRSDVSDTEISRLIARTLDTKNPREWYWALMDYGSHLKCAHGNNVRKSKHYRKQSRFNGSDRQIRGSVLRELTKQAVTRQQLLKRLSQFDPQRFDVQLERLLKEGMIVKEGRQYQLPD